MAANIGAIVESAIHQLWVSTGTPGARRPRRSILRRTFRRTGHPGRARSRRRRSVGLRFRPEPRRRWHRPRSRRSPTTFAKPRRSTRRQRRGPSRRRRRDRLRPTPCRRPRNRGPKVPRPSRRPHASAHRRGVTTTKTAFPGRRAFRSARGGGMLVGCLARVPFGDLRAARGVVDPQPLAGGGARGAGPAGRVLRRDGRRPRRARSRRPRRGDARRLPPRHRVRRHAPLPRAACRRARPLARRLQPPLRPPPRSRAASLSATSPSASSPPARTSASWSAASSGESSCGGSSIAVTGGGAGARSPRLAAPAVTPRGRPPRAPRPRHRRS